MTKRSFSSLPYLNATLEAQCETLSQTIAREIQLDETHSVSFARFMEMALYEPNLGYYTSSLNKLGKKGDFVTAPEISPLFARCLGRQCQQVFTDLGGGDILEIGAGTGKMARDLLLFLGKKAALPGRYYILEISPYLKQVQQALLKEAIPDFYPLIEWLDDWPVVPIQGVIIANEVADALPVHRFLWTDSQVREMRVMYDDKHKFSACYEASISPAVAERLYRLKWDYFREVRRYESEICLGLADWIKRLRSALKQGLVIISDYGYTEREYYHPERCQGTIMCYHQQRGHANPFILVGLQDITASVNFSLLARCAKEIELTVAGYTSQAAFLINNGLLHVTEECYDIISSIDINRQVYWLTSPNEMGELIKVIGLTYGYESKVQGFIQYDKRARL